MNGTVSQFFEPWGQLQIHAGFHYANGVLLQHLSETSLVTYSNRGSVPRYTACMVGLPHFWCAGVTLSSFLAMTETTAICLMSRQGEPVPPGSAGLLAPGVEGKVVDGELCGMTSIIVGPLMSSCL